MFIVHPGHVHHPSWLDAGVHPTGMASLPFIDDLDWSIVDAILITVRYSCAERVYSRS
jgi:hypothetical protein